MFVQLFFSRILCVIFFLTLLSCNDRDVTAPPPLSDDAEIVDIDGNVYSTVRIGNQIWSVENLRTTRFADGDSIPYIAESTAWSNLADPGFCYYDNTRDPFEIERYGALYNWYAVHTKKLAPPGWRIPSDSDWAELEIYLVRNGYNCDGSMDTNRIAKSLAAESDWMIWEVDGSIGNQLEINNKTGFSALPGGRRNPKGSFIHKNEFCTLSAWWNSA